ncbi:hypothetical protein [Oscillospiraceae bacterium]|nr:hypothetical protein [Oscillospiraceae bacterium]
MNEKNLKIVRYITGVLFLALAITSFLYKYTFSGSTYAIGYAIGYIVSALGAAIMAVSMFLGMRQVFIVGAGFQAVSCLIKLLALHENIMNILSAVLLLAGYVLAAFAIQDKKNTSKYVIVSVVLFLIGNIANQIAFLTDKLSIIWALKDFVSVASPILLACIVFENIPQAQTTKMVKQPTKTAKSNDRIEELTKLKDLLDTGVISQEEFDAKKKQIFGV